MKVAIVGGGIAGLSAAIAFGRIGVDVEIFERSGSIREIGAGLSLWPNATRVLRELDLLEPCLQTSSRVRGIRLVDPGGREWVTVGLAGEETPALCLDRPALLAALLAAVDPKRIHVDRTCERISLNPEDGRRPRVHFEGGRTLEFDVVIGADGMGSAVRAFVTGRVERPVYRGYMIWRGVARVMPSPYCDGLITEAWGRGERFGIMPIGDGKVCWYATRNQPDAVPPLSKGEILDHFRGWHRPIAEVVEATPEADIVRTPALDRPTTRRWARGPVVLIGDAAHPMTPNLGQGTCQAVQDAFALSLLVARSDSVETAIRRFERVRRPRVAAIVLAARWIGGFAQSESRVVRGLGRSVPHRLLSSAIERAFRAIHDHQAGSTRSLEGVA